MNTSVAILGFFLQSVVVIFLTSIALVMTFGAFVFFDRVYLALVGRPKTHRWYLDITLPLDL